MMDQTAHMTGSGRFSGWLALVVGVSFVLVDSESPASSEPFDAKEFAANAKIGSFYGCYNGHGIPVLAILGAVDQLPSGMIAFGVQLIPVSDADFPVVGHAPFIVDSFASCLRLDEGSRPSGAAFDSKSFQEGYAAWRDAGGGVFSIPINEIYDLITPASEEGTSQ